MGFERFSELRRLQRGEPVVRVVQEDELRAELVAHGFEDARDVPQVGPGVPGLFGRSGSTSSRLVVVPAAVAGEAAGLEATPWTEGKPGTLVWIRMASKPSSRCSLLESNSSGSSRPLACP
ncbi:hypothetical protein GU90_10435 [Saccharopolyspora rectivirgula]|uniref:Uncharacterized protein n=1 Tax=Saccharopolyspora rectivirgula TaxID=28042 RepID=A0A073AYW0_9PSEU|nr:hypothetical protein GU90_10435 [Saccharopolyspora rectivirgula]